MAKKIRFPLILKDGYQVKDLEELQSHFDLDKILDYYKKGQLQQWLQDRYYETEYAQIMELDSSSDQLGEKICSILGVESDKYTGQGITEQAEEKSQEDKKNWDDLKKRDQEEAERKIKQEMERKAREEVERKAREEMERKAKEDAERKIREEIERKVREEMEEKARKEAAERRSREEAERKVREEQECKARQEAERKIREEIEFKAREEAEQKIKESVARETSSRSDTRIKKEAVRRNNQSSADPLKEKPSYLAVFSLVCSLLSWVSIVFVFPPIPLAVIGIILGTKGRKSRRKKMATVGIVISSLLILLYISIFAIAIFATASPDTKSTIVQESELSQTIDALVEEKIEIESTKERSLDLSGSAEPSTDVTDTEKESEINEGNSSEIVETSAIEDIEQKFAETTPAIEKVELVWPDSDSFYYNQMSAELLSYNELKGAISEIYGRHGIVIRDEEKEEYFSKELWYKKQLTEAGFNDSVLNEFEENNLSVLEWEMQKRKQEEEEELYLLPGSDRVKMMGYTIGDRLDKEEMQLAIYEIYARHGMIFEDPDVASYFSEKPWYEGEIPEAEFDYNVLNEAEIENIETMENIIKYRD